MIKLRAQGTKNDLKWLRKQLERMDVLHIISCSEILSNVGTDKYYRMFIDVGRDDPRKKDRKRQYSKPEPPRRKMVFRWQPENRQQMSEAA